VTELHDDTLARGMAAEAAKVGFTVAPQDVELHGACGNCRAQAEEA